MSEDDFMKYALSFLFGAATGAAVALLFAPSSGGELRTNIKTQADTEYARLKDDYHKGLQEIHTRLDKMSSELQDISSRTK